MRTLSPLLAVGLRAGAHLASPGGRHGSLLVLMYHRVLAASDPLLPDEPDAATFAAQMDLVSSLCNVISLTDAVARLAAGELPPRALVITFDDGYVNNLEVAAPILVARGLTATFFIATGFAEGGCMFNDLVLEALRAAPETLDLADLGLGRHEMPDAAARRQAMAEVLPRLKYLEPTRRQEAAEAIAERSGLPQRPRPMMSGRQLRELAALGMEIGAHCMTHPILARISPDEARHEIGGSKQRLQEMLGVPVVSFAYPNGKPGTDYGPEHVAMVRDAGFHVGVTTAWGAATPGSDPCQIPRIAPWDRSPTRFALRLLQSFATRSPGRV